MVRVRYVKTNYLVESIKKSLSPPSLENCAVQFQKVYRAILNLIWPNHKFRETLSRLNPKGNSPRVYWLDNIPTKYTIILRFVLKFRDNAINLLFEQSKVSLKITSKTKAKKILLKSDLW